MLVPSKINENVQNLIKLKWNDKEVRQDWFMKIDDFLKFVSTKGDSKRMSRLLDYLSTNEEKKNFAKIFQDLIANILLGLAKYLPFTDELVDTFDMLNLEGDVSNIEDKFIYFNEQFGIIPKEDVSGLLEEINELMNPQICCLDRNDILNMWHKISNQGQRFGKTSQIALTAQSLPLSSAVIEQKFSTMKLVKTDLRNRLSESGLQACLLIQQECDGSESFPITKEMVEVYSKLKTELNQRKSSKLKVQKLNTKFKENNEEEEKIVEIIGEITYKKEDYLEVVENFHSMEIEEFQKENRRDQYVIQEEDLGQCGKVFKQNPLVFLEDLEKESVSINRSFSQKRNIDSGIISSQEETYLQDLHPSKAMKLNEIV